MKMNLKACFQPVSVSTPVSVAMLLLRLIVGIAFLYHGWGKIQTPFAWMPAESGVPGFFQFLAALSEFGGGIALIIGLLLPLAMLGLAITMFVATMLHAVMMKDPFVNMTGGKSYELPLIFLGIAVLFMVLGAGKISLDHKIFGDRAK